MKHLALLPLLLLAAPTNPEPGTPVPTSPEPVRHCQVPCGIYGDTMRVDMILEDAATIEKAMGQIGSEEVMNQAVRWIVTKDEHASHVQELVASYWLAQRIKAPADGDEAARAKYLSQLQLLHGITVAAMKCKQTTDPAHVARLRDLLATFSKTYFSKEDLEHLKEHGR